MININKINELKSLCIDINAYELDININDELDNLIEKLQVYIREEKDDKVIDLLNKVKDKAGLNGCSAKVEELIKLFLVYDFDITEKEIYNKIPHLDKSTVRDAIKLLSIKKVINEHEDFDGEIKYYTFNERILDNDEKN